MLCFGGKRGQKYTNDLWQLAPVAGDRVSWTLLSRAHGTQQPSPRAYHTATVWRERFMLLLGGVGDTPGEGNVENVFWIYENGSGWRVRNAHGDAPAKRCHHTATVGDSGDSIYVYGGFAVGGNAQELMKVQHGSTSPQHPEFFDVYELSLGGANPMWRRIQSANVPPMLWGHSAMLYANSLIMQGGVDVVDGTETKTICVWHTDRHEWRWVDFNKAPHPRALHSASVDSSSKYMYVFGGFGDVNSKKYNDIWKFSANSGQWSVVHTQGPLLSARAGHASCLNNETQRLYVHGGTDSSGGALSDTYYLNLSSGVWTLLSPVQAPQQQVEELVPAVSPNHQRILGTQTRGVQLSLADDRDADKVANAVSHYLSVPADCLSVTSQQGQVTVHISTTNAPEAEQELLRRCLHPDDPLRAHLGVVTADWGGAPNGKTGLPQQVSNYPLALDQVIPHGDDRRQVQSYHYPQEEAPRQSSPGVMVLGPAPSPAKLGVSQTVQTDVGSTAASDVRPLAEEDIIRKQRLEIEHLNQRLNEEVQMAQAPQSISGYLSIPEEFVLDAPQLSKSTPQGPKLTLTKTTLADMLPYVTKNPASASMATPQLSEAARQHVTRSSMAAAVERRAAVNDMTHFTPMGLPTASVDTPTRDHMTHVPRVPAKAPVVAPSLTGKSPSLRSILQGNATMLSITHLGGKA